MHSAIYTVLAAAALAGCVTSTPPTAVHQPMSARPAARNEILPSNGAIYQASHVRPLFEDRRARFVGDTISINIVEKTQAAKKSNTGVERSQDLEVSVPTLFKVPGKSFQGLNIEANHDSKFSGKGESAANNTFTGTITCTVIEVLPNGNLLVSGEKLVAINQGEEFIRFSGVVNPAHITAANIVTSTQVADARIEYKANGAIDSAQVMGWLARFFLTFLPF
ncbi:MAG: flagellar basal body L-ring protein FlgH [Rhodocyclaceae bacterium]|nr:flagellar basal body L-ring protein FlgH [Rhodocyclaceae bacterium]MBX3678374.1 flagellar basal body L-ring protein FlgH [Rhodocyclaceae bacterium]MCB1893095.1 flagellar basal body L-ring protein FlgH [Rhodocyclaceae bacterium]MCP5297441.1 flagellar basal body L-ring protein FlgH [Zoogloeaceae bacterium]MCW5596426.1 flagellar basal body L-ring protein FlgH [Rhodocyclaceae bacterium]